MFFAATDNGLENALKITKDKITIPEEFQEFSYSMSTEGSRQIWNLSWRNKNDKYGGNLSVRIDDKGTIESYYFYKGYSDTDNSSKLPKFSIDNAEVVAKEFLAKVNPEFELVLIKNSNNENMLYNSTYRFSFVRFVNGLPLYSNTCNIEVNRNTCDVESYNLNWTYDLQFPDVSKAISLKQAEKAYINNIGLKLAYKYYTDENDEIKVLAIYMPKYEGYSIDAITGEKTISSRNYYGMENAKNISMDMAGGNG